MASYEIPQFPTKRLRYFNNQFLNERDFIDDQAYQIGQVRAQLRALCVGGVCEGLVPSFPTTGEPPSISRGSAIDNQGRLIVLDDVALGPAPDTLSDGDYFLHIRFHEEPTDMAAPDAGGAQDNTRWHQEPIVAATRKFESVPDGAVILGSFRVAAGALVYSGVDELGRQYSGVRLPGPDTTRNATLTHANGDAVQFTGSLTVRRDSDPGELGPVLTLTQGAGGSGAGAAIDFNGYYPGTDAPSLRLQSVDDGNYSSALVISTKQPGAIEYGLRERLRLQSDGVLCFANTVPSNKLVIYDNGPADSYGIGLESANINVFYPSGARFSLRQENCSGPEVFTVNAGGDTGLSGKLNVQSYPHASAGVNTPTLEIGGASPTADGQGGGVLYFHHHGSISHQLRYEHGTLHLEGCANGYGTSETPGLRVGGIVSWGENGMRTEARDDAGLSGPEARSGFYQTFKPQHFPPGASGWWHLLDVRHTNPNNNHALQIAGGFFDQEMWFRKTANDPDAAWRKVVATDAAGNVRVEKVLYANSLMVGGVSEIDPGTTNALIAGRLGVGKLPGNNARGDAARLDVAGNLMFSDVLSTPANMHLYGNGQCYLLHRDGARVSTQWGGNGQLHVDKLIGIGTRPSAPLHIRQEDDSAIRLDEPGGAVNFRIYYESGNQTVVFYHHRADGSRVNGQFMRQGGVWEQFSDVSLKRNVSGLRGTLDKIMQLEPVSFDWIVNDAPGIGFIAQDVERVMPEMVSEHSLKEGKSLKALPYATFAVIAIAAIREMKNDYDARFAALERRCDPE